jgi:carbamoyl-phosphate synthase small subunit
MNIDAKYSKRAILVLDDGTTYYGWSYSKPMTSIGEIVFNTGITGYQEIITDPSYSGQIVSFTYPELGNTGINEEDLESNKPRLNGIIAKNICTYPSNWRKTKSFIEYLHKYSILHIYGVDTRALTKHLRQAGTMNGCISNEVLEPSSLLSNLHHSVKIKSQDFVQHVSTLKPYRWLHNLDNSMIYKRCPSSRGITKKDLTIVVIDFGTKYNILRNLYQYVKNIIVVPASTPYTIILKYKPDGILLSNGPGDPEVVDYGIQTVKNLLPFKIPILGICMGHQILSLAFGLEAFKLKFGHRGLNHPVGLRKNIEITSQNHGFAIKSNILLKTPTILTQLNYNDQTTAAITHRDYPYFSVQYHPEASPGPHDSSYLFTHFLRIIKLINKYPLLA